MLPALARAAGPSLGSVCLGSLLVSLVEGLRSLIRTMVQSRRLSCLGGCLLDCVAAWVEEAFRLANRFAFVFVVRACVQTMHDVGALFLPCSLSFEAHKRPNARAWQKFPSIHPSIPHSSIPPH